MDPTIVKLLQDSIEVVRRDVSSIEEKVDKLLQFKWQIIGGAAVASLFLTALVQIIIFFIQFPKH